MAKKQEETVNRQYKDRLFKLPYPQFIAATRRYLEEKYSIEEAVSAAMSINNY